LTIDLDADNHRIVDTPPGATIPPPDQRLPGVPLSNYFQTGVALRASWSTTRGYAETLGATEGFDVAASMRYDDPAFGARYRNLTMSWGLHAYWKLPFGDTPAIALRWGGGVRVGDIDRGNAFSLGGAPSQDFGQALISQARVGSSGFLRGYPNNVVAG